MFYNEPPPTAKEDRASVKFVLQKPNKLYVFYKALTIFLQLSFHEERATSGAGGREVDHDDGDDAVRVTRGGVRCRSHQTLPRVQAAER